MSPKDDEFRIRLLATFQGEAIEHIQAMSAGLIELEKAERPAERATMIETVFREAHSLKGAARAVNLLRVEAFCQSVESVMDLAKRGELELTPEALDVLHSAVETLKVLLGAGQDSGTGKEESERVTHQLMELSRHKTRVSATSVIEDHTEVRSSAPATPTGSENVRISATRLEALLLETEELLTVRMGGEQLSRDLVRTAGEFSEWKREWKKVQPLVRVLERAMERAQTDRTGAASLPSTGESVDPKVLRRLIDFLGWNESYSTTLGNHLGACAQQATHVQLLLGTAVDTLLRETKQTLMLPCSYLTDVLPALVRELSRVQRKEVDLTVSGIDIEVDRRVLQEIREPVIHLLRNCIDHGIETPSERTAKGKPVRGTIAISVTRPNSSNVELRISDDGAGIDGATVNEAAAKLRKGSAESEKSAEGQDPFSVIFWSGVSTSKYVTDISGRGLGLAIVREKVDALGGKVSVLSSIGTGTTFILALPVTLSTFRGLLVKVGEREYVIPIAFIERVAQVQRENIRTVENRLTVSIEGTIYSFADLRDVLGIRREHTKAGITDTLKVVILDFSDNKIAFAVDEIAEEQEVLVKGLGPQLRRVNNVSGAAVLGSGKVVPVLHTPDLLKSAMKLLDSAVRESQEDPGTAPRRRSILVVEDSITARNLMKNILEGSGFSVTTAVDGVEALATVRENTFDLVVSDVDMPRMNGFELTARIKNDRNLAELPVVLITALESPRDRERGIEVGASAYIVKSSFEQHNLLEIIDRLV